MKDYVTESSHKLSIAYEPDVLIAGGGIAGVAAALAAARNGATVLLVEKQCMVGGLATSGLVAEYLPLCDGMGHQVCFGIAEELLRLSLESGAKQPIPTAWLQDVPGEERKKMRYRVQFLPHQAILDDIRERKESGENPDLELTTIAGMPQLRMIRCIEGEYCLKETENEVCFPDSIGMTGDWRKSGMRYEIPYRALYNSALRNAICAGRCISVDDGMWDISRVIPPCVVTGEAAGTAAALAEDFHTLSYDKLAERLEAQGQKLKISQVSTDSAQLS